LIDVKLIYLKLISDLLSLCPDRRFGYLILKKTGEKITYGRTQTGKYMKKFVSSILFNQKIPKTASF
jgi:hypothetical protein